MRPLLESIITNNVQSRALAATRDYLLPKVLSGEVSVDSVEEVDIAQEMVGDIV